MLVIDCHAHFEPRMLGTSALLDKLDAAGVDRVALIPCMNDPLPSTPEALLSLMRAICRRDALRGLAERVHRATLTPEGDLKLRGDVIDIYPLPDNAGVAALLAQQPTRFLGWIFLNPAADPQVLDSLERWRSVPGMIGVKLHPHWHDWHVDLATPLLARCEELGLPVLIHFGFRGPGDFRAVCSRFPRLTVIAAHAGFPFYDALWRHGADHPRLFVDLSSPYVNEALVRDAVRVLGPERCLYGTDAPYGFHAEDGSYDYGEIRRWVERLPVSSAACERIFGALFAELIGLG
jgi:uncharacterized protein